VVTKPVLPRTSNNSALADLQRLYRGILLQAAAAELHTDARFLDTTEARVRLSRRAVQIGDSRSTYLRDPFGNIIELMQLGDDEPDFDLVASRMLPAQLSEATIQALEKE
jgi:hypothetical protein